MSIPGRTEMMSVISYYPNILTSHSSLSLFNSIGKNNISVEPRVLENLSLNISKGINELNLRQTSSAIKTIIKIKYANNEFVEILLTKLVTSTEKPNTIDCSAILLFLATTGIEHYELRMWLCKWIPRLQWNTESSIEALYRLSILGWNDRSILIPLLLPIRRNWSNISSEQAYKLLAATQELRIPFKTPYIFSQSLSTIPSCPANDAKLIALLLRFGVPLSKVKKKIHIILEMLLQKSKHISQYTKLSNGEKYKNNGEWQIALLFNELKYRYPEFWNTEIKNNIKVLTEIDTKVPRILKEIIDILGSNWKIKKILGIRELLIVREEKLIYIQHSSNSLIPNGEMRGGAYYDLQLLKGIGYNVALVDFNEWSHIRCKERKKELIFSKWYSNSQQSNYRLNNTLSDLGIKKLVSNRFIINQI